MKEKVDLASFDESRILSFECGEGALEEMIQAKKNKRRKLIPDCAKDNEKQSEQSGDKEPRSGEIPQSSDHYEYSDEDEDINDSYNGAVTFLDSVDAGRRGLDSHEDDNEPCSIRSNEVIEETVAPDVDLTSLAWTRCDFNDVEDDALAFNNQTKPCHETVLASESPLTMFMLMVPHVLWEHIAKCSEMKRVALIHQNSFYNNRNDMKYMKTPILAHKVFIFVCVLILNMLHPYAGGMANHWRTDGRMLRRAGIMGQLMPRDEFRCLSRCLCFYDPLKLDKKDKFTKIRYVVTIINSCFQKAICLGPWASFGEATVSTKSSMTPARQFNPFKPHKFGWKLFMMCCAVIGYCYSFEIYQGNSRDSNEPPGDEEQNEEASEADAAVASTNGEDPVSRLDDTMTGPAALLRNCAWMAGSHRTVFCDRYYTSVGTCIE